MFSELLEDVFTGGFVELAEVFGVVGAIGAVGAVVVVFADGATFTVVVAFTLVVLLAAVTLGTVELLVDERFVELTVGTGELLVDEGIVEVAGWLPIVLLEVWLVVCGLLLVVVLTLL